MSRRYRDQGHQFWAASPGPADAENAQWLMEKFRQIGLTDVREQPFDLPPQWMPQSWSVKATGGGKALDVTTAQPTYLSEATSSAGLDLEAVWAGLGSDADLALAPNVDGKAVFFYSTDLSSRHRPISDNAIQRIEQRGAAAIFVVLGIPGNLRTQFYPVGAGVPTFSVGQRDGLAMRDLIAGAKGQARINVRLSVQRVPNLKSGTVWGTLPGATDETIIVVAHRDGWFEAANDNAAGVATALGLADTAKCEGRRRRTIIFLGTTGPQSAPRAAPMSIRRHCEDGALNAEHSAMATPPRKTRTVRARSPATQAATARGDRHGSSTRSAVT
jgi:hypothetical protein